MGVIYNLFGQGDVVLKAVLGAVNHHGGKTAVNAGFADSKILAVVQMQSQIQSAVLNGGLHQLHQINMLGIFACAGANLQNQRRFCFLGGFSDALNNLHIVDVEGSDGVPSVIGFFKHIPGIY